MGKKETGLFLFYGGLSFSVLVILWVVFMVITAPTGSIPEQFNSIKENPWLFNLNFFIASMIAPVIVSLVWVLGFNVQLKGKTPVLNLFGASFLLLYLLLVTISYTMQFAFVPGLLREGLQDKALLFYFHNPSSFAYYANQTGYFFFGVASIFFGTRFLIDRGKAKVIGIFLFLTAVFSIVAFLGLILSTNLLNLATIISGFFTLPLGIIMALFGRDMQREISRGG